MSSLEKSVTLLDLEPKSSAQDASTDQAALATDHLPRSWSCDQVLQHVKNGIRSCVSTHPSATAGTVTLSYGLWNRCGSYIHDQWDTRRIPLREKQPFYSDSNVDGREPVVDVYVHPPTWRRFHLSRPTLTWSVPGRGQHEKRAHWRLQWAPQTTSHSGQVPLPPPC